MLIRKLTCSVDVASWTGKRANIYIYNRSDQAVVDAQESLDDATQAGQDVVSEC